MGYFFGNYTLVLTAIQFYITTWTHLRLFNENFSNLFYLSRFKNINVAEAFKAKHSQCLGILPNNYHIEISVSVRKGNCKLVKHSTYNLQSLFCRECIS